MGTAAPECIFYAVSGSGHDAVDGNDKREKNPRNRTDAAYRSYLCRQCFGLGDADGLFLLGHHADCHLLPGSRKSDISMYPGFFMADVVRRIAALESWLAMFVCFAVTL